MSFYYSADSTVTARATAQGASGAAFANQSETVFADVTAEPSTAHAASLISDATHVADAFLTGRNVLFGTAILGANYAPDAPGALHDYSAQASFDVGMATRGLLLGLIDNLETGFDNGKGFDHITFFAELGGQTAFDISFYQLSAAETFFRDLVLNLGPTSAHEQITFGYDLFASGDGGFALDLAVGGAVPEPSTWAMLLAGFGAMGVLGRRALRAG